MRTFSSLFVLLRGRQADLGLRIARGELCSHGQEGVVRENEVRICREVLMLTQRGAPLLYRSPALPLVQSRKITKFVTIRLLDEIPLDRGARHAFSSIQEKQREELRRVKMEEEEARKAKERGEPEKPKKPQIVFADKFGNFMQPKDPKKSDQIDEKTKAKERAGYWSSFVSALNLPGSNVAEKFYREKAKKKMDVERVMNMGSLKDLKNDEIFENEYDPGKDFTKTEPSPPSEKAAYGQGGPVSSSASHEESPHPSLQDNPNLRKARKFEEEAEQLSVEKVLNAAPRVTLAVVGLQKKKYIGLDGSEESIKVLETLKKQKDPLQGALFAMPQQTMTEVLQTFDMKDIEALGRPESVAGFTARPVSEMIPSLQAVMLGKVPYVPVGRSERIAESRASGVLMRNFPELLRYLYEYLVKSSNARLRTPSAHEYFGARMPKTSYVYFDETSEFIARAAWDAVHDTLAFRARRGRSSTVYLCVPIQYYTQTVEWLQKLDQEAAETVRAALTATSEIDHRAAMAENTTRKSEWSSRKAALLNPMNNYRPILVAFVCIPLSLVLVFITEQIIKRFKASGPQVVPAEKEERIGVKGFRWIRDRRRD